MSRKSIPFLSQCVAVALIAFSTAAFAQDGKMYPIEAPDEPGAIPLETGGVEGQTEPESWFRQWGDPMARNISRATLTPVLADPEKANGTSVIVAPGGGFMWLSMGNEGWEVAEALAEQGINAFVLKYRLQPTAPSLEDFENQMNRRFEEADESSEGGEQNEAPERPRWDLSNQIADVEAAYSMILKRADEWGVDPERIGMIGFSAGAGLTMATTLESDKVELAFIGPIYGGMNAVDVPKDAPPMFAAIAADDFLFNGKFGLIESWYEAGIPVEFHLYQNGGHGFGLGNPDRTSNKWFGSFMYWLEVNGFLKSAKN
ncbi:alpha/beta hydrolase [Marinimicrobium sp. C6131]|uniref:alpha/beta hydrolase n=1 Tax=Marinimicrobium sp. C6131 TaxID=3022676 RepID=UPI00223D089D|nr:alpha/beta hydrolase [Marinimicrobium sp. C6131]UZJ46026.1 alpha/beta hydrolase [Marinimicrobium sp. C6131]